MPKLRMIIGQGTAAEVFRATSEAGDWHTVVLGPRGLWAAMPQNHRMGQPAHLLQLPGQAVPGFATANGQNAIGMNAFLDVATYQQRLQALSQQNDQRLGAQPTIVGNNVMNMALCRAVHIGEVGTGATARVMVTTTQPDLTWFLDQVVICSGIGAQQTPQTAGIAVVGNPPNADMMMDGVDYLAAPPPYGREIVMYGGGATSAWVADMALHRGAQQLTWIARPGGSGFNGCVLPGHRNAMILERTVNNRIRATVQEISFLPAFLLGGREMRRPKVRLRIRPEGGDPKVLLADQFIYSIGGDLEGPQSLRNLIDPLLLGKIAPILDRGRAVSDGTGVLALGTADRSLLIVGAATYNFTTPILQAKQRAPMAELPLNAQVADGIAMVSSAISALHDHVGLRQAPTGQVTNQINLNTGNRNEVAVLVATRYPQFEAETANLVVEAIIGWRSADTRQFGIDPAQLDVMVQELLGL